MSLHKIGSQNVTKDKSRRWHKRSIDMKSNKIGMSIKVIDSYTIYFTYTFN